MTDESIQFLTLENERLQKQVTELQARMTEMVNAQLSRRVRDFMLKSDQPVAWTPKVPDEKRLRFRLKLVVEEFLEMIDAVSQSTHFVGDSDFHVEVQELLLDFVNGCEVEVDLPKLVDALADLDYVIEGFRATLGVDGGGSIADAVHAANLAKVEGDVCMSCDGKGSVPSVAHSTVILEARDQCPLCKAAGRVIKRRPEDGKILKPEGWKPPDVEGELRKQGWEI